MRIDVPTLQCDRCKTTTQDKRQMSYFKKLSYYYMSGKDEWDLCPSCWTAFKDFMAVENV